MNLIIITELTEQEVRETHSNILDIMKNIDGWSQKIIRYYLKRKYKGPLQKLCQKSSHIVWSG